MISTAVKIGYVDVIGAGKAYIREYDPATMSTRAMVNGEMIDATWNGKAWAKVQEKSPAPTEEVKPEEKYAVLNILTVAMYIKWLKKNARKYGRRAEFGNGRQNGVEVFVKEVTGIEICFTASGEVQINGEMYYMVSGWTDIAYYTYDDEEVFVTTFGKALKYAEWQSDQPFIADWHFQG
jgi:hypothetical protein